MCVEALSDTLCNCRRSKNVRLHNEKIDVNAVFKWVCMTAICARALSNESSADVRLTARGWSPCLSVFPDTFHLSTHFQAQCAALNPLAQHTSLPADLPLRPPNARILLVCVGRFHILPCHLDYTQTHNAPPASNQRLVALWKSETGTCCPSSSPWRPSPAFSPHSFLCLQQGWPLTLLWPHTHPTKARTVWDEKQKQ